MSLRTRLFTLLLVSCVALATSTIGMVRLISMGAAAREASAAAVGVRAVRALAHHLEEAPERTAPGVDVILDGLAHTLEDGTIGVCSTDGDIGTARRVFRPGPRPPPDDRMMMPLDAEHVTAACRVATSDVKTERIVAPMSVLSISTLRALDGTGPVAFALTRVPRAREGESTVSFLAFGIALATTAALFGLTAHGAWVLRSSTASLRASVEALKTDLRSPIEEPKASELADVARHLRTLASTLADSRDRERSLTRDVEEQKRLAGLGRVVAGVAHEVRNPLAGMKLRLDLLARRALDPRSHVDVKGCLREVDRLDRLVRSLLLASRKRTPDLAPFDAASMIEERIALAEPLATSTDVHVVREGSATVLGEEEGLAGALDNLLRNAIEASPQGGHVVVRVRPDESATHIEVSDEGGGVSEDRVVELFEPFFTTKGSGTGLGLVLARSTLEAHGGTLDYQRRDGHTIFMMSIPNAPSRESARGLDA